MSESIDALAESDTDIFANLVEDLTKRMAANRELVCLKSELYKVGALAVRGHEGLDDMHSILAKCEEKLQ